MPCPIEFDEQPGPPPAERRGRQERPHGPDQDELVRRAEMARRHAALRETVVEHLGRPDDLARLDPDVVMSGVDVRPLWDANHYRVNVYRDTGGRRTMTDSFFVRVVADGLVSSPPIVRKYPTPGPPGNA